MAYATAFPASWAKQKKSHGRKTRGKEGEEASVTPSSIQLATPAKDENHDAVTSTREVIPEAGPATSIVTEVKEERKQQQDEEAVIDDLTAVLAAAGIRAIDFAYITPTIGEATSDKKTEDANIVAEPTDKDDAIPVTREQTATSNPGEQAPQVPSNNDKPPTQYASSFPQKWRKVGTGHVRGRNESRDSASLDRSIPRAQGLNRDDRPGDSTNTSSRPSQPLDGFSASSHGTRHSGNYSSSSHRLDNTLSVSLDSRSARLLKEQFSANEFLAYYQARSSRDEATYGPIHRSVTSTKAETPRVKRSSANSAGDTPPKYHRASSRSTTSGSSAD